jgi:hypothetical protein
MKKNYTFITLAISLILVLSMVFSACNPSNNSDGDVESNVNGSDQGEPIELAPDILAEVNGIDISRDEVMSWAAIMTFDIQGGKKYDEMSDEEKSSLHAKALLQIVELTILKAKYDGEGIEVLTPEDITALENAAKGKYETWTNEGIDLATLKITEDVILLKDKFTGGYVQRYKSDYREESGTEDINTSAAYQDLLSKANITWSDSVTVDEATGFPTEIKS